MFTTSAYTSNYPAADESETGITLAIAFEDFLKIRPARLRYTMIYLIFHKNQIKSIIEIGLIGVQEAYFRR